MGTKTWEDTVMKPSEAKEAMGGMVVPEEVAETWWDLTSKLLETQAEITWKARDPEIEEAHKAGQEASTRCLRRRDEGSGG